MRIVAIALLFSGLIQAQPSAKQVEVDKLFSAFNTHTPGCAVGVAVRGNVVLRAGYGMADLERNVPITASTIFESGSVAKQFTAAALILLAQQGKISLEDPLQKYLPELPDYGKPVAIRQVLSHVSGLREWRAIAAFSGFPEGVLVYDNQDLLRLAARQRALNFEPGTDWSYTNTGFNISTILVERALGNGKTFQDFTRETIFAPLGMSHSRWRDNFRTVVQGRALAYTQSPKEGWVQDTPIENIIGAGGLLTTVGDLLLWNENFTTGKVGGHELLITQQTPAVLRSGRKLTYAAGLMVSTFDGLAEVSHSGSTGGYRTWLGRYPEQGISVAVMCNSAQANAVKLGRETARLWTGGKPISPSSTSTFDREQARSLAGMYRNVRDNTVLKVRWQNGKLATNERTELTPISAGKYLAPDGDTAFEFEGAGKTRLREVTPNGDILFERAEPAHPTAADLKAFAGAYGSAETGTTLTVSIDPKGELNYRIGSGAPVTLRPTFQNCFETPATASVCFLRDASGNVTTLTAGESRVWDLRFNRVN